MDKENTYIRAGRYDTPATELFHLSQNPSSLIRVRVAENQATPQVLLEELSTDSNEDVRIAVGGNPSIPFHVLMRLAFDEHVDVRFSLAENHCINILALLCLAGDENPFVSQRALKTLQRVALGKRSDLKRKDDSPDLTVKLKQAKPKLRSLGLNPRAVYPAC
jgi:hypothetical protein